MSHETRVRREDRFAIFWGGGLGDVLVLRPLLLALEHVLERAPDLFTTADHMPGVFADLSLRVELHLLPPHPLPALRVLRQLKARFDWLYLGPYPRIKTRMLSRVLRPKHIWSARHPEAGAFIGEQILADVAALGLAGAQTTHLPYGGHWQRPERPGDVYPAGGYLLLHPGAKARWETTRWPAARWRELIGSLLSEIPLDLLLVGVEAEREQLEELVAGLHPGARGRIELRTQLDLQALAAAVENSAGVVCHNSGILHLAAMLDRPTVALTGSSARFWRPPYPHVENVTSGACELACNQYRCPVPFYRARCIRELTVESVMDAVRDKLHSMGNAGV